MFSKVGELFELYSQCYVSKGVMLITASKELSQHFNLLILIFNHFIQLLDHVVLPTFQGVN